ncbi:MAG: SDR family oxidoreductase [Planctomycetaceae bacterium]|nr:SDR family oxidoreductase [Planctomycetaceae bacterium]
MISGKAVGSELRIYRNSVAIVTGGASGIGRALGIELAKRGAIVVLADLQVELAEEAAAAIRAEGGQAESHQLDVTDFEAMSALVNDVVRTHGRLDFMFNNAGITVLGNAHLYELDDWNRLIDVNLKGVIHGVQAAYPTMRRQGFGHVVNTASITGLIPVAGLLGYTTTKHAIVGLSNSLRVEAAEFGVRVSVLCPGAIETPIAVGGKYGRNLHSTSTDVQRKLWEKAHPISPTECAQQALSAIGRNKAIIVIPGWWKILWFIYRVSPLWGMRVARRVASKQNHAAKELANRSAEPLAVVAQ